MLVARWCPFCCLVLCGLVIRYDVINTGYTIYFTVVVLCVKLDPDTHKGMHSVLALKTGCDRSGIRAVLTVGHKPRVDWTFLRTYSLQNYFLDI
jgi:hypothetical protein